MQDLSLQRMGSLSWHAGFSLVVTCGFSLSSCGAQAPGCVGSVVLASGSRAHGLCSLQHTGSLVEARELSSCGAGLVAPRHVGS